MLRIGIRSVLSHQRLLSMTPPATTMPLSPSRAQVSSMTTSRSPATGTKRASSPASASSPHKLQKTVQQPIEVESFDDEIGFDQDALIEATIAAEEEEQTRKSLSSSSQPASSPPSSSKTTVSVSAKSQPVPSLPSTPSKSLTHGDATLEEETMDKEWYDRLKGEMQKPYFTNLKAFLKAEVAAKKVIYPPAHLVHSWSRLTPLSTVKVVVVGQDPYHGPNQACGHSFSVQKGVRTPPSLMNMYKELTNEYGAHFKNPGHGCLDGWATQGVLLLNACLTVQKEQAGSHHNKGWEPFTQAVLKAIAENASKGQKASIKSSTIASMFSKVDKDVAKEVNAEKEKTSSSGAASSSSPSKGVVFLAWGNPAQKSLREAGITEKTPNVLILSSAHPSPLSAMRGFMGNGHFKKANDWLEADSRYGKGGGIDWARL